MHRQGNQQIKLLAKAWVNMKMPNQLEQGPRCPVARVVFLLFGRGSPLNSTKQGCPFFPWPLGIWEELMVHLALLLPPCARNGWPSAMSKPLPRLLSPPGNLMADTAKRTTQPYVFFGDGVQIPMSHTRIKKMSNNLWLAFFSLPQQSHSVSAVSDFCHFWFGCHSGLDKKCVHFFTASPLGSVSQRFRLLKWLVVPLLVFKGIDFTTGQYLESP